MFVPYKTRTEIKDRMIVMDVIKLDIFSGAAADDTGLVWF